MSGPVSTTSAVAADADPTAAAATVEVTASREAKVGRTFVRRALPRRGRRTVGPWCFADHFGPVPPGNAGMQVGPHPHIGLQTVTWLLDGEVLHRDSLGSEQLIRPGQLNLMTAGAGVVHAEETPSRYAGGMHGAQLWVAQPEATRHGPAAFEHHAALPQADLGTALATVLVGSLGDATSPARADTGIVGADLAVRAGAAEIPLRPDFEHALVVLDAAVLVAGTPVEPGALAYLGTGRDVLSLNARADARVLLLGGTPFPDTLLMWWNFVARTRDEVDAAYAAWQGGAERFGPVDSMLGRIAAPSPPWQQPPA